MPHHAKPPSDQPSAKPGRRRSDTIKITVALVGIALAGVLLAWNLGVFGTAKPTDDRTPQQHRDLEKGFEEQEQLRQEMEQDPATEIGSLTRPGGHRDQFLG